MTVEQQFQNIVSKEGYITNPTDYYYTHSQESLALVEGLRIIYLHNKGIISSLQDENISLNKTINIETVIPSRVVETPKKEETIPEPTTRKESTIIDLLTHTYDFDTITKIIDQSDPIDRPIIKLFYYKKLQELKLELLHRISINPLSNNQDLISRIEEYTLLLEYLEPVEKQEEQKQTISNIIILPNKRNSSYLYEDILNYLERSKEIKNALDKLLNEYFGKATKSLKGYTNLYEYTHPNGIRILYVVLPNNKIGICSIFYKDKNKSTKITNYYEEAISRFNQVKEYVLANLTNPDFYIEQAEIIAEIYTELENNLPLSLKKDGE